MKTYLKTTGAAAVLWLMSQSVAMAQVIEGDLPEETSFLSSLETGSMEFWLLIAALAMLTVSLTTLAVVGYATFVIVNLDKKKRPCQRELHLREVVLEIFQRCQARKGRGHEPRLRRHS